MGMKLIKEKAIKMRLLGHSYNEITASLGVSKSTLHGWLSGMVLSPEARLRIDKRRSDGSTKGLLAKNSKQTHDALKRMSSGRKGAALEIEPIDLKQLRLVGTALYWAEGYKRPIVRGGKERTCHPVSFANSDPELVKIFICFLSRACGIDKNQMKAEIRGHEHLNERSTKQFWVDLTGIPEKNFGKTYFGVSRSSQGKKPFNRLPYGTITIRVNDTVLFHRIMGWIDGLSRSWR